jgi:hypothetical protein
MAVRRDDEEAPRAQGAAHRGEPQRQVGEEVEHVGPDHRVEAAEVFAELVEVADLAAHVDLPGHASPRLRHHRLGVVGGDDLADHGRHRRGEQAGPRCHLQNPTRSTHDLDHPLDRGRDGAAQEEHRAIVA